MTARLPTPGGDDGDWGNILNSFLEVSLNSDGTLNSTAVANALPTPISPTNLGSGTPSTSNFLRGDGTWAVPNGGSSALAQDTDVAIVSPSNNQVLTYNSGGGKWENENPLISSVFGRTGAVVATTGDYTAAEVTNAASTSSSSTQTFTGNVSAPALIAAGLTGATAASRYVGATSSGAPASGTFVVGDFVIDQTAKVWVCTTAGSPGTWTQITASNGGVTSLTAGDTSIVVGGTAGAPTLETATLDVIATDHPAAANWSNNSFKITSLANGSASTDAAAFGQIPTASTGITNTSGAWSVTYGTSSGSALQGNQAAGGDLSDTLPSPTVAKINGISLPGSAPTGSGQVLATTSTSATAWETLQLNQQTVATKTSPYTLTTSDGVILANTSSGSFTITLPTAVGNSDLYNVKKTDSSSNTVTVAASNGQTIDGGSTAVIKVQYAGISIVSDGSNWYII